MAKTKNKTSHSKSRLSVGAKNFITCLFAICAFLIFIPIAGFTAYYILARFGKADFLLNVVDKFQLRGVLDLFSAKFTIASVKRANEVYLLFSVISFFVLLLLSSKNGSGNIFLHFLYILGSLAFVYYFALRVLFPTDSIKAIFFNPPKMDIKEAVTALCKNMQFLTCIVTILPFTFSVIAADRNKDNANATMAQVYENALNNLNGYKRTLKPLKLLPTYWSLFFIFVCQFLVSVIFIESESTAFIFRGVISLIAPLANNAIFKTTKLEAKLAYQTKYSYAWKNIAKTSLETADIANNTNKELLDDLKKERKYSDTYFNKYMFWMGEAKYWHSKSHDDACFLEHYRDQFDSVDMEEVEKSK